ncbi:MAG TPA: DUF3631 domain-containing protein [Gemmatimonadaceae bacterium]|nr:DUF3631 domain-containing protein [Gemmatimonadaceae bacterium]
MSRHNGTRLDFYEANRLYNASHSDTTEPYAGEPMLRLPAPSTTTDAVLLHVTGRMLVEATVNSATKVIIRAAITDSGTTVPVDKIDIMSHRARAAWAKRLPPGYEADGLAALADLAQRLDALPPNPAAVATDPKDDGPEGGRAMHPEPVDLNDLLYEIVQLLERHLVLQRDAFVAAALWVVHTYCIDVADYTPYLWVRSATPECGKSTLLELLGKLVWRPLPVVHFTTAYLFRTIEKGACTLLADEIDKSLHGERRDDLVGILNAGFKRGLCVGRVDKGPSGELEPREYRVFGAKIFSGIGRRVLSDATASRCIRIDLRKASRAELRCIERPRDAEMEALCAPLRAKLLRWASDNVPGLAAYRPAIPDELAGRKADIADPLLTIAELAGRPWSLTGAAALVTLLGVNDAETEYHEQLVRDVFAVFRDHPDATWISSETLVRSLNLMEERPWPGWHNGSGVSARTLAGLLHDFDIAPKINKAENNRRGYYRADFARIWDSYEVAESAPSALALEDNELAEISSAPRPATMDRGADANRSDAGKAQEPNRRQINAGADGSTWSGSESAAGNVEEEL